MNTNYTDAQLRVLEKAAIECQDFVSMMDDYVDEQISHSLYHRFSQHIEACGACKEALGGYKMLIESAAELANKKIPSEVQNRLRLALNKRLGLNLRGV